MLNKKQFITVLISSVIVFAVIFTVFYTVVYKHGIENPIVQPEATLPVSGMAVASESDEVPEMIQITPDTEVTLRQVDQMGTVILSEKIPVESVLGFDKEALSVCFKDYEVRVFSAKEVVLEKVMRGAMVPQMYKLALQGEMIGIKAYGNGDIFIPLGLSVKDYSRTTQTLLLDEMIEITASQKIALEANPDQIEQILQDYSE